MGKRETCTLITRLVWNPYNFKIHPILVGHNSPVQSLALNEQRQHLISLGTNKNVRIWDIKTYTLISNINDPFTYRPDNMYSSLLYDPFQKAIIYGTCKLNIWPLKTKERIKVTHDEPVCFVIYNSVFESIISGDSHIVALWNTSIGSSQFKFQPVEQNDCITAACLDSTERRLVIGSHLGVVKIWNFSNGNCLSNLTYSPTFEINCIEYINFNTSIPPIIAVGGWKRQVLMCNDSKEEKLICNRVAPPNIESGHGFDVSVIKYACKSLFTCGVDGSIFAWNLETLGEKCALHKVDPTLVAKDMVKSRLNNKEIVYLEIIKEPFIAIVSADQKIRIWNDNKLAMAKKVDCKLGEIEVITAAKCWKGFIFIADSSGNIKCYQVNDSTLEMQEQWYVNANKSMISSLTIVTIEPYMVVSGSVNGNIVMHNLKGKFIGIFWVDSWDTNNLNPKEPSKPIYEIVYKKVYR